MKKVSEKFPSNDEIEAVDESLSDSTSRISSGKGRIKKMRWGTIMAYSAPMIGAGGMNFTLTTFAAYFYTDTLGLSPGIVGYVQLTLMIMYAISEPIFGTISDITRGAFAKKFGRRKPYLAISAIFHAATFYCLIGPPYALNATNGLVEWAFVFAVILGISWGCNEVVYQALGAQLTFDYDERTKLQAVAVAVITTGSTSCGLLHGILGSVMGDTEQDNRAKFMILAITYSSLFLIGTFLMLIMVEEHTLDISDESLYDMKVSDMIYISWISIREMVYNMPFFLLTVSYSCTLMAGAVTPMLLPYFAKHIVKSNLASNWAPLMFTASAVAGMPIWVFLGGPLIRMEKKWRHLLSAIWLGLFLALSAIIVQEGSEILFMFLCVGGGLAMGGYFATPEAMKPDVVDYDEFRTGARHEARFAGVFMLFANLSAGIGLEMMLLALELFGYAPMKNANYLQNPKAILTIRVGYGSSLPIMTIFIAIAIFFYPITRLKHEEIIIATQKRLNGEFARDPLYGGEELPPYENCPIMKKENDINENDEYEKPSFIDRVKKEVVPLSSLHGNRNPIRNIP